MHRRAAEKLGKQGRGPNRKGGQTRLILHRTGRERSHELLYT